MTPRRHVDALFTAAHDDDLSPIDDARFHAHIRSCKDCAAGFVEFVATVEALHELPKARMARVVHLPSTPPVAERSGRPGISLGWLNAGLLRRFPATAIAGAAAVVLIILALVRGGGPMPTSNIHSSSGSGAQPVVAPAGGSAQAACAPPIATINGSALPVEFSQARVATAASLPGARLVLATPSLSVKAGQSVVVYAQLSFRVASLGVAGTTGVPPATRTVRPCVSVVVGGTGQGVGAGSGAGAGTAYLSQVAPGAASPAALYHPTSTAPLLTFVVPPGLAPGTQLHVVASIPAGFEGPGTPALTATLTLVTR
jgi:anti-sigma factor RsiW